MYHNLVDGRLVPEAGRELATCVVDEAGEVEITLMWRTVGGLFEMFIFVDCLSWIPSALLVAQARIKSFNFEVYDEEWDTAALHRGDTSGMVTLCAYRCSA